MENKYTVETYSRKPLLERRQYYWRIRHWNGNIIARSSEGYNNKQDCEDARRRLFDAIRERKYVIKEVGE